MKLTTAFERDGFQILPDLISKVEAKSLVEDLEYSSLRRSKAGIRHALRLPTVEELARDPRFIELVQAALGPGAIPFRATLFDKSFNSNWLVVWHQDTALPLAQRFDAPGWGPWSVKDGVIYAHAPSSVLREVVALRIHLDDSDCHNGPLRVLPGTHTRGVLTDDEIHGLVEDLTPVDCLVPRGGALIMRPLIVHASSKSVSKSRRRVLHIEYASSGSFGDNINLASC